MPSYSTDRRGALKILGAIGASCVGPIAGDELYGRTADEPAETHTFFAPADFAAISRIADLIIPGALAAGVPAYIDLIVSRTPAHQSLMTEGLHWLDQKGKFLDLSEEQQLEILQPLCEAADADLMQGRIVQFFALVKGLTADGYYTSKVGLMDDLGYQGNTAHTTYPDCPHEH
jgi:hypothetical protein